jgi:hypothetical protein
VAAGWFVLNRAPCAWVHAAAAHPQSPRHDKKGHDMAYDLKNYTGEHYLKPDDVRDAPLQQRIAGLREGKFGKLEAIFESGDILSINATNMNVLVRAYGESSDDLIGKDIETFLGKIKYAGADNDAVLVRPVTPPTRKAKPSEPEQKPDFNDEIPF